jgi:hypothetical protein
VFGDFATSGETRKETPTDVRGCLASGSDTPRVAGTLDTECGGGKLTHQSVANGHIITHPQDSRVKAMGDTCQTVSSTWGSGGGNIPFVQQDTVGALCARDYKGVGNQFVDEGKVIPAIALQGGGETSQNSQGSGWNEDVSFTLNSVDKHAVAFTQNDGGRDATENTAPTLRSGGDGGIPQSAVAYSLGGQHPNAAVGVDVAPTLASAAGEGGGHTPLVTAPTSAMQVRRLTPKECERLQGFPDDYTKIPYRKKSADDCPDGPRYKALGNSMAVPVMRWIGERINQAD